MSAPGVVTVDHEATADYIKRLRALADDIDREAPRYSAAILDAFRAEASQGTATGQVAPLYLDAVAAMETVTTTMKTHLTSLATKIRADAAELERATAEIGQADEDGARSVGAVGDIDHGSYVNRDNPVTGSGPVGDIAVTDGYVTRQHDY